MCLTGFFSFVPTMFFYSLPPPPRSHHPSLALFAPLHAQARLQVHHPRGGHATSRVASARNLNPGSTAVCARCDRGWPRPKSSHTVRKASGNQTTPGQSKASTYNPLPRGLMDQPFQCLGYRPLALLGLDWRLLTDEPIVNTARSLFSSPLLPSRQGFVCQY